MALQDKLEDYNTIYRFQENPQHFSFSFSPERVIIRNEALRTGNKELYETFLRDRYPEHADVELELFDKSLLNTKLVTIDEAQDFIERHGVTVLLADLAFTDKDTIFAVKPMYSGHEGKQTKGSEEPINSYVSPSVLEDRELVWLDVSEMRLAYTPEKS